MNRTWLAVLLSLLVCGAPWSICCGQGTSGSQFLGIEAAARPMGMGGAFVSVADGVTSLGWNPAGLVRASGRRPSGPRWRGRHRVRAGRGLLGQHG
jgi:hypothetical protein